MNPSWWNPKVSPITALAVILTLVVVVDPAQSAIALTSPSFLRLLAVMVAGYALYRGPVSWLRAKLPSINLQSAPAPAEAADPSPPPPASRSTYQATRIGRLGNFIATHLLISIISGVIGFSVIKFFVVIFLSSVLGILGVRVQLPQNVAEWRRNFLGSVKEHVLDIKENVGEKFGDVRDAMARKLGNREIEPIDPDAFFGGPPIADLGPDGYRAEVMAFDALPPESKLGLLASARKLEKPLSAKVQNLFKDFEVGDITTFRVGRSTSYFVTEAELEMFRRVWEVDMNRTHSMEWEDRQMISRLSCPNEGWPADRLAEAFDQVSGAEAMAMLDAAKRYKRPVPDGLQVPIGWTAEDPLYRIRLGCSMAFVATQGQLQEMKEEALEKVIRDRGAEDRSIKEKARDFADKAREKGGDIASKARERADDFADAAKDKARDFGDAARGKARYVASHAREAAANAREDAMEAVRGGVKDAAKDTVRSFLPW